MLLETGDLWGERTLWGIPIVYQLGKKGKVSYDFRNIKKWVMERIFDCHINK